MLKYCHVLALACLAGCADDSEAVANAFVDRAEAGSTWVLAPGPGELAPGSTFTGACPTFAPMMRHLPDNSGDCPAGCSCWLAFSVEGDDELTSAYVEADFQLHCANESQLFCYDDSILSSSALTCFWDRNTESLQSDCVYPAHLAEIAPPP